MVGRVYEILVQGPHRLRAPSPASAIARHILKELASPQESVNLFLQMKANQNLLGSLRFCIAIFAETKKF